ncbi:MAG: hypothetical protein UHZ01_05395, partial [Prevotella sp.]|nr:hypothetical protein [Prevotella sp.]
YGVSKAQRLQERIGSLARDVLNAVFKQSGIDIDLAEPVEVEQVAVVETENGELNQRSTPEGAKVKGENQVQNGELETENGTRQTENGSISSVGTEENGSQAASEPQARNRNMDREAWKKAFKKGGEKAYDLMYELHGGIVSRFPQEFLAYLKGVVGVPSDVANVVEVAHNYLVHDFKNKNPELFKVEDAPAVGDVHSLLATKGYSLLEHTMDNGKAIGVKMMYRDKFVPSGQTDTSYTPEGQHGRTVICYYSDPDSRLHQQYVFTVTKNNATETPTAYELAADPSLMTPEWADYLEKTGRKNEDGSYNLEGLQPDFSDPFSLSHLMIRIGKTSGDVEIISRYNHGAFDANGVYQQIAGQPNATLDGNLNKLASGLYGALADYKNIKPQDVMLAEGVKIADDGKVYRFTRMAGDIYVGDGFWIKDNEAHVVDRNKERMVGDVVVGKDYVYDIRKNIKIPVRKAAVIDGGIEFITGGEAVTEIREIEVNGEKRKVEKTTWKGGEKTTLKDNVLTTEITDGELLTNVARMARPEEIVATDIKEVGDGFLSRLAPLERVEMPNLERVGNDAFSRTRVILYNFPKLREVGDGFMPGCTSYSGIEFPSLEKVGNEFMSSAGTFGIANGVVILSKLREVGDGFLQGLSVQSVVFKSLEVAGDGFLQNAVVKTIGTPELRQVGENFMSENANKVEVMSAPKLENVPADFMQGNAAVRESIEEQRQAYLEEQQESEQTMFRKMNEHAEEFNKTHKGGVPVVDIDPNNMEAELAEEGFTTEEIKELKERVKKGVAAVYNTDKKIIYLLVPSQDKESVYSTCWHEDTHAAIDFLGLTPEMIDEFYSFAQGKKKEAFEALLDKFGYDKEAYPEESLAYGVQAMQILDNWGAETLSKLFGSTAEGAQRQMEIIQPLINYINNGRQGTQSSVGETVRDRGMYNNTANQKKTAETEGTGATATGGLTEDQITERTLFRRAEQDSEEARQKIESLDNEVLATIEELAQELYSNVGIITDIESIPDEKKRKDAKRGMKGWYDPATGVVAVVLPNIA